VLPLFFAIGIIFAPIGGLLIWASSTVKELRIDYTNCFRDAPTELGPMPDSNVRASFRSTRPIEAQWQRIENVSMNYVGTFNATGLTNCTIQFRLPEAMDPPVLFYYYLTNFYQNHRRYVTSFFDRQLRGEEVNNDTVSSSPCWPLATDPDGRSYYPCGLIANSQFNDTFSSPVMISDGQTANRTYSMRENDIAWASDRDLYGRLPANADLSLIVPPPNWQKRYPNGRYTTEAPPPVLPDSQHFMVWMRTAGLPSFSKLYMRNDVDQMPEGYYRLTLTSSKLCLLRLAH
jgi:hypothetical protein